MNSMKDWIVQLRYPYTAGILVVVWIGTALFLSIGNNLPLDGVVVTTGVLTVILAALGFSSRR